MKVSLYDKLVYIFEKGYFPFIVRFSKVTIIHISLECLISIYILELTAILTNFFLVDPTSIPKLIVMVIFPSITVILLSFIFGVVCTLFFVTEVYNFSKNIDDNNMEYVVYKNIIKIYRKDVVKMHILGLASYIFSSFFIPLILISLYPEKFTHPTAFLLCMSSIGCLLGIIWNVTGIYRNQRILWHILLPRFGSSAKEIAKKNYDFFLCNVIGNITSILCLTVLSVIVFQNIHPLLLSAEIFDRLITDYGFFIISFVALIAYYIKKVFSLLYSFKNKDAIIYPSLNSILECSKKNTEKHHL